VKKRDKILTVYSETKPRMKEAIKFFKESLPIIIK